MNAKRIRTKKLRRFIKQRMKSRGKIRARHRLKSGRTGTVHHKKLQQLQHERRRRMLAKEDIC